jgi:hypothetical protein
LGRATESILRTGGGHAGRSQGQPHAPAVTSSRTFFDSIRQAQDPVGAIETLCDLAAPTFETDWLHFKQDPSDDDKRRIMPDDELAVLTGRPVSAVTVKRPKVDIPTYRHSRQKTAVRPISKARSKS